MSEKDGGSAFPRPYFAVAQGENVTLDAAHPGDMPPGMTVRQWYIGQAITGLLANQPLCQAFVQEAKANLREGDNVLGAAFSDVAATAIYVADQILARSNKEASDE